MERVYLKWRVGVHERLCESIENNCVFSRQIKRGRWYTRSGFLIQNCYVFLPSQKAASLCIKSFGLTKKKKSAAFGLAADGNGA